MYLLTSKHQTVHLKDMQIVDYSSIKLSKSIPSIKLLMVLNCSYSCFITVNYFDFICPY